ncbi:MAG: hypothetical protein HC809_08180 [Gammaproteobacteria bacterium]|nr:hypothetical protein [Gammaproteobacteria bacterium]
MALTASAAAAAERVDQKIAASAAGEVSIDVVRGRVVVVAWDEDAVQVVGTRDEESQRFVFEREGNLVRIQDEISSSTGHGDGTDIEVRVPHQSLLRSSHVSADLDVSGVAGSVRARTVSGRVKVAGGNGDLAVRTVSGDINVKHDGPEAVL